MSDFAEGLWLGTRVVLGFVMVLVLVAFGCLPWEPPSSAVNSRKTGLRRH